MSEQVKTLNLVLTVADADCLVMMLNEYRKSTENGDGATLAGKIRQLLLDAGARDRIAEMMARPTGAEQGRAYAKAIAAVDGAMKEAGDCWFCGHAYHEQEHCDECLRVNGDAGCEIRLEDLEPEEVLA